MKRMLLHYTATVTVRLCAGTDPDRVGGRDAAVRPDRRSAQVHRQLPGGRARLAAMGWFAVAQQRARSARTSPSVGTWNRAEHQMVGAAGLGNLRQSRRRQRQGVRGDEQRRGLPEALSAQARGEGFDLGVLLCFDAKTGKFLWQHSSEKLPVRARERLAQPGHLLRPDGRRRPAVVRHEPR